jgi:hypothetical protein
MTDIVDRLRKPTAWAMVWGGMVTSNDAPFEAADKIECLREALREIAELGDVRADEAGVIASRAIAASYSPRQERDS